MIRNGLQRYLDKKVQYEEEFTPRFAQKYGENHPYKNMIFDMIHLDVHDDISPLDFATLLLKIQHLVPMFVSFLENKKKEGMFLSFKRNALAEYFNRIAPKRKIQNFRAKNKKDEITFAQTISQKNDLIRKQQQKEAIELCKKIINDKHIL